MGNSYRDRRSLFPKCLNFFFNNIIVLILNSFQVPAFITSYLLQPSITTFTTSMDYILYPIFVLFISPVKIEIFQVCLSHIIENFVFHPKNKIVSRTACASRYFKHLWRKNLHLHFQLLNNPKMQLTKDQRIFIVLDFKETKSCEQVRDECHLFTNGWDELKKINNVISIIPWYKHNLPLFIQLLTVHS